jgi:hypothetical protein
MEPGLHWVVPFVEWVQPYSISRQSYTLSIAPNEGDVQGDDSIRPHQGWAGGDCGRFGHLRH